MAGNFSINRLLTLWQNAGMPPTYIDYLTPICAPLFSQKSPSSENPLRQLPHIFCQHTGGNEQLLQFILIAWNLLRQAARILDDFEDADTRLEQPRGLWLNTSTSLIFSANLVLAHLEAEGASPALAQDIRQTFTAVLMQTVYGQHLDLLLEMPTLEERWQISQLKSARFLGLLMWLSARLGTDQAATLQLYQEFGELLGMMDQIHDDLLDLWSTTHVPGDLTRPLHWSLPVSYAFSVLAEAERQQLQQLLNQAHTSPQAEDEARTIILNCGAKLYLTVQLTICNQRGRQLVQQMELPTHHEQFMITMLDKLQNPN